MRARKVKIDLGCYVPLLGQARVGWIAVNKEDSLT